MSTLSKTFVHKITKLSKHPNADSLDIIHDLEGFTVVCKSGLYKEGDLVVYVKPDMEIFGNEPEFEFLGDKRRVKACKLRGIMSYGLVVPARPDMVEGQQVDDVLRIKPYVQAPTFGDKPRVISNAPKGECGYTDIQSLRKYHNQFRDNEEVYILEKIHGQQARHVYQDGSLYVGTHHQWLCENDIPLWRASKKYDLYNKLQLYPNLMLCSEHYGWVQDLRYGHNKGETSLVFYDIFDISSGRYLNYPNALKIFFQLNLPTVPILYQGPWKGIEHHQYLADGNSVLFDGHIKEGIVIKPATEQYNDYVGRLILKLHSDAYLSRKSEKVGGK